jgi:hypothetical protein
MLILKTRICAFRPQVTFLLAVLLAAPLSVKSQVLYGSLTGFISDQTGAAVSNVRVEAQDNATGTIRQTTSDDRGSYSFADLQAGVYRITASSPSFKTAVRDGIQIEVNSTHRLEIAFNVADVNENITVSAQAPALQTDRADTSSEIQSTEIQNIPMSGQRNYQNLLAFVPGVTPPLASNSEATNPQGSIVSNTNGVSFLRNQTRLDGASNIFGNFPSLAAYIPPAEAIETVNTVTNSFDAEQGMAGGSIVNVFVRSGTNQFHGAAWWYNNNSSLASRNFFYQGSQAPKNIQNQGGASLGGPILKNKLFFFLDWERTSRRQSVSAFRTVATAGLRVGNFANTGALIYDPTTGNSNGTGRQLFPNGQVPLSRMDPAALKMQSLLPLPNESGLANDYFSSGLGRFDRNIGDLKINYNPSQKLTLFGRYSAFGSAGFDPPSLGAADGDATTPGGQPGNNSGFVQSATIGGTYTASPRIIIDGNIGYTRQYLTAENVDIGSNYGLNTLGIPGTNGPNPLQGGIPAFVVSGFSSFGNDFASSPFLFRDNQFVYDANVSWTVNAHSLRFGWESLRQDINHFQPQYSFGPRGGFSFSGGLTSLNGGAAPTPYNGWADYLLGLPQTLGKDLANFNPATLRLWSHAFYVQDHWQITKKFTLDYGVRWEIYPYPGRDHGGAVRYDPASNQVLIGGVGNTPTDTGVDYGGGQWVPRVGFAWNVLPKTVIRGGFGLSADSAELIALLAPYPAVISTSVSGNNPYQSAGSLQTGIPAIVPPDISSGSVTLPGAINTITAPQHLRRGLVQSYNFTIERDMGSGLLATVAYVGTRFIHPLIQVNINAAPPGGGNPGRALAIYGQTGTISEYLPTQSEKYDSLQAQLTRRFSSTQFGAAYTYSKSINYEAGLTDNWAPAYFLNKSLSDADRPNNFHLWVTADLPFGPGKKFVQHGIASQILRGWQINGTVSAFSGLPFSVVSSAASLNAPGNQQTADQVIANVKVYGNIGPGTSYYDPTAFAPVTAVRFGTSGRNILRGPASFQSDLSLFREFAMREKIKLQIRAEAFNFTNTPSFFPPGTPLAATNGSTAAVGQPWVDTVSNATRNADGSIRSLNGYTSVVSAVDNSRQIRLGLRLNF